MTTRVRTLSLVSVALLVAALALALVASASASADESPAPPDERRPGWMMTNPDRPMMDPGEWMDRHGAMDDDQMRQHHGTMRGDEQMRERHREVHGEGDHHGDGPMRGDAVREQLREDCDHSDGPQRSRDRASLRGMSTS